MEVTSPEGWKRLPGEVSIIPPSFGCDRQAEEDPSPGLWAERVDVTRKGHGSSPSLATSGCETSDKPT
jgi:hypothetical protein